MTGQLLEGSVVVEIADPLTEFAGLILAGLGAEVLLVEPPGGSPTRLRRPYAGPAGARRSVPFLARNLGKRSVIIDAGREEDRQLLRDLSARADGVLSASTAALHELVADAPAPRVTIVDEDGCGRAALVAFAAGGGLSSCGWPHQPPTNAPGYFGQDASGIYAAAMLLIAMRTRGIGGPAHAYEVVAKEAATAASTPWTRPLHSYGMAVAGQGIGSARLGAGPYPVMRCKDGYVRVLAGTPRQWEAWITLLGRPAALTTPEWETPGFRAANFDAMVAVASEIVAERTVAELFHGGQKLGLTITPVLDLPGFLADEHVNARGFVTELDDPDHGRVRVPRPPFREGAGVFPGWRPAPGPGDGQARARELAAGMAPLPPVRDVDPLRPLAGHRVLAGTTGAVGPEATSLLALLGAEVIKIESRRHVDFLRQVGLGGLGDHNNAPTFNQMNLGVKSIALDMSTEAGRAIARELARHCDIVVENMRGPVMAKWGLSYEEVRALRPDVIYVSSQGLGDGPYGGYQTYGPNLQAFSGVTSVWAHPDDPYPVGSTLNHPDHVAGKQALAPLLAAIIRRDRTGEGAYLDCAQFEAAATLIADQFLTHQLAPAWAGPRGNRSLDMAPHGCYPCDGDDTWCAIAIVDDREWQALAALIGEPWAAEPAFATTDGRLARADEIDRLLGAWTRQFDAKALEARLRAAGICASKVRIGDDLAADADAHASGFFAVVTHPTAGTRAYTGLPVRLGDGRRAPVRRAPLLGEHDGEVLCDILRLSATEVSRLAAEGVIGY